MPSQPLEGIEVLDFGQLYNGPYCSLMLSYLGADVIKVEPPFGEPLRSRVDEGEPPEMVMINSSKEGITLDLKSERGKEILKELVKDTDVLVENYAVGTMDDLGLGYETLSEVNPELVYAHGSGFGEEGEYSEYTAMDLTIQAIGGVMNVTGFPDGPPVKAGIAVADFLGGIHLATGVLAALYEREETGKGQFVEVSMHDAVHPTLTSPLAAHYHGSDAPSRTGNRHSGLAHCPYNVYDAADGYIAIFCVTNKHWRRLLDVLGREDLKGDPRYDTNLKRTEHMDEIDAMIEEVTSTMGRDAIAERLRDAEVPCGPVKTLPEVADDPHFRERGMIQPMDHPSYDGEINAHGSPIRLSNSEQPDVTPSLTKGEDNTAVYARRLGLSEAEVRELEREGVI
jgi:CoA:oxalate CoA-transferase